MTNTDRAILLRTAHRLEVLADEIGKAFPGIGSGKLTEFLRAEAAVLKLIAKHEER